jgi:hypothetical protein
MFLYPPIYREMGNIFLIIFKRETKRRRHQNPQMQGCGSAFVFADPDPGKNLYSYPEWIQGLG